VLVAEEIYKMSRRLVQCAQKRTLSTFVVMMPAMLRARIMMVPLAMACVPLVMMPARGAGPLLAVARHVAPARRTHAAEIRAQAGSDAALVRDRLLAEGEDVVTAGLLTGCLILRMSVGLK
jgi:hypothetical protein